MKALLRLAGWLLLVGALFSRSWSSVVFLLLVLAVMYGWPRFREWLNA